MKECPLQKIEAEFGSLGYRVMERTSFRAGIAPAEVQRLSPRTITTVTTIQPPLLTLADRISIDANSCSCNIAVYFLRLRCYRQTSTPEGGYILDSQNPNSHFYKAFHVSYPSSKDIASARKLGVSPGGDIMLHGLPKEYAWVGKSHTLHDWTDGCIAVTNQEMDELWKLVRVGTPIDIKP
jgi:hypothetical protein